MPLQGRCPSLIPIWKVSEIPFGSIMTDEIMAAKNPGKLLTSGVPSFEKNSRRTVVILIFTELKSLFQ
jgi:hypothetical protein